MGGSLKNLRGQLRASIEEYKSIDILTDYASEDETLRDDFFLKFLIFQKNVSHLPLVIGERKNGMIDLKFYSNRSFSVHMDLNCSKVIIAKDPKKFEEKNCMDKNNIRMDGLLIKMKDPLCVKIFACHLEKNRGTIRISQRIIFLMSFGMDYELCHENENLKWQKLKIFEFEIQGFCICDHLEYYMNDCHETERDLNYFLNMMVLFGYLGLTFVFIELSVYFLKE